MTDQDRRRSIRHSCDNRWVEINLYNLHTQTSEGPSIRVKIDNISGTGACLISSAPFELGQIVLFSEDDIPGQGEVVWTCQSRVECKAGVQFS